MRIVCISDAMTPLATNMLVAAVFAAVYLLLPKMHAPLPDIAVRT